MSLSAGTRYTSIWVLLACAFPAAAQSKKPAFPGLEKVISRQHWISYAPTHYFPANSPPIIPSAVSVREDLVTLREAGFTGLITYGAQVESIPDVAEDLGFRAMILGIWDPFSTNEKEQALKAVRDHRRLILGLIGGNEGLLNGRYDVETLCGTMDEIRKSSGKPVSTTEPVDWILSESKIGSCSSFITANAHPYFANRKMPAAAVEWTVQAWGAVRNKYPRMAVLLKEVGLPSGGDEAMSQEAQRQYYVGLAKTPILFSYFEAYDATPRFKEGSTEQSWGLWTAERRPKSIVESLPWRSMPRR